MLRCVTGTCGWRVRLPTTGRLDLYPVAHVGLAHFTIHPDGRMTDHLGQPVLLGLSDHQRH